MDTKRHLQRQKHAHRCRAILAVVSALVVVGFSAGQDHDFVVRLMQPQATTKLSRIATVSEVSSIGPAVILGGRLVVQTEGPTVIEVFDANGQSLGFLPSRGDPVRFADRSPMAVIARDTLVILDRRGRQLVFYSGQQPIPHYVRAERLDHAYVDACSLGNALLLYRIDGTGAVYVRHQKNGGRQSLLVDSLWTPRPAVQQTLNDARLVCDPAGKGFALIGVHSPQVRWYRADGSIEWQHDIPGYRRIVSTSTGSGVFTMSVPRGGYHALMRAVIAADSLLLLQLAIIDTTTLAWGGRRPLTSHAFEVRSGRPLPSRGFGGDLLASEGNAVWALGDQGLYLTRHAVRAERDRR